MFIVKMLDDGECSDEGREGVVKVLTRKGGTALKFRGLISVEPFGRVASLLRLSGFKRLVAR